MAPVEEWGTAFVLTPHMRCADRPRERCARSRRARKKKNEAGVPEGNETDVHGKKNEAGVLE